MCAGALFTTTGSCVIAGRCIASFNHGSGNYDNYENCAITFKQGGEVRFDSFDTERSYDILTIDGTPYSGSTAPAGVTVQESTSATWRSDGSDTQAGWRMCMAGT